MEIGYDWDDLSKRFWDATTKRTVHRPTENRWWNSNCFEARTAMKNAWIRMRAGLCDPQSWRDAKREYKRVIKATKEAQKQVWL